MMSQPTTKTQVLHETNAREKVRRLESEVQELLEGVVYTPPATPGRDVQIVPIRELPPKKGFSTRDGQARLLHDLASIELQAMELGVRTLAEFPEAPREFREQLAAVTLDEGRHLKLCLDALEDLKLPWGSFSAHIGLWQAVDSSDSLLDRILIVHRYLEGSGLDASETILRRLDGVQAPEAKNAMSTIRREEIEHVRFGSNWYREIAKREGVDPSRDFAARLERLFHRIPRRLEPIDRSARLAAGFTDCEVDVLEKLRMRWMSPPVGRIHQISSS